MAKPQQKPALQAAAAPERPAEAPAADEPAALPEHKENPAAPPTATTDNPWRHLHPARVWPD